MKRLIEKAKNINGKKTLAITIIACSLISTSLTAYAAIEPLHINSQGRIVYNDTAGGEVVIDSDDIRAVAVGLYNCQTEVDNIYGTLNEALDDGSGTPLLPGDGTKSISELISSKQKDVLIKPCDEILTPCIAKTIKVDCSDADVTANQLSVGAKAFDADGTLVEGNGANENAARTEGYNQGYADGLEKALDNVEIQYTYHSHTGTVSGGGGCYTVPIYKQHVHTDACYAYTTHKHTSSCISKTTSYTKTCGCSSSYSYDYVACPSCGHGHPHDMTGQHCNKEVGTGYNYEYGKCDHALNDGYSLVCGKTAGQRYSSEGIESYALGCEKTTSSIDSATIVFKDQRTQL